MSSTIHRTWHLSLRTIFFLSSSSLCVLVFFLCVFYCCALFDCLCGVSRASHMSQCALLVGVVDGLVNSSFLRFSFSFVFSFMCSRSEWMNSLLLISRWGMSGCCDRPTDRLLYCFFDVLPLIRGSCRPRACLTSI